MDSAIVLIGWAVICFWIAWALTLLFLMVTWNSKTPCYNGFKIILPAEFMEKLSHDEQIAVYLHEDGHKQHFHVWKNYLRACFLLSMKEKTRQIQEIQADDYVIELGWGVHLSSVLYRLGTHPFDTYRANRIKRLIANIEAEKLFANLQQN